MACITLGSLSSAAEKEQMYTFLLENNVHFKRDVDGAYVANIKIVDAPSSRGPTEGPPRSGGGGRRRGGGSGAVRSATGPRAWGRRASRPPAEMARMLGALAAR